MDPLIVLFSDFGLEGPYTGQVKTVLQRAAPGSSVIDLFADAPAGKIKPAAYLLAAYGIWFPPDTVLLAVVDPGVGSARGAVIVEAEARFELVIRRADTARTWVREVDRSGIELASICRRAHTGREATGILLRARSGTDGSNSASSSGQSANLPVPLVCFRASCRQLEARDAHAVPGDAAKAARCFKDKVIVCCLVHISPARICDLSWNSSGQGRNSIRFLRSNTASEGWLIACPVGPA